MPDTPHWPPEINANLQRIADNLQAMRADLTAIRAIARDIATTFETTAPHQDLEGFRTDYRRRDPLG